MNNGRLAPPVKFIPGDGFEHGGKSICFPAQLREYPFPGSGKFKVKTKNQYPLLIKNRTDIPGPLDIIFAVDVFTEPGIWICLRNSEYPMAQELLWRRRPDR